MAVSEAVLFYYIILLPIAAVNLGELVLCLAVHFLVLRFHQPV